MNDLDRLIEEELIPLRKRVTDALAKRHPHLFSLFNGYLAKKDNHVGLQVTENGKVIGQYTFYLDGMYISRFESGTLASAMHHPFGTVKPYGILEKKLLEKMLQDEEALISEPFSTMVKYLPEITIKFLR